MTDSGADGIAVDIALLEMEGRVADRVKSRRRKRVDVMVWCCMVLQYLALFVES